MERVLDRGRALGGTYSCSCNVHVLGRRPFRALYSFVVSRGGGVNEVGNVVRQFYRGFNRGHSKCCAFPATRGVTSLAMSSLTPLHDNFHTGCLVSTTRGIADNRIYLRSLHGVPLYSTEVRLVGVGNMKPGITSYYLLFSRRRSHTFPGSI